MPPATFDDFDNWSARVQATFTRYAEPLLRDVATRLVKARVTISAEELVDRCTATLTNPPVIDRRIQELPPAARTLLALVGMSRRPTWKIGHLLTVLAAVGHVEGLIPVNLLLNTGLLLPARLPGDLSLTSLAALTEVDNVLAVEVFTHPAVAGRARGEPLNLPPLAAIRHPNAPPRFADGLDWPLKLALVWQQVAATPVRLTQAHTLFKRDLTRLQTDELLSAATPDQPVPIPDAGVLSLFWAEAAGLIEAAEGDWHAAPFPATWGTDLPPTLTALWAALTTVEPWDPLLGYAPPESGLSAAPTAGFLALLLLGTVPEAGWTAAQPAADWLWDHHPSWQGTIPRDHAKSRGRAWVEAFWFGVAYPLRLVEATQIDGTWCARLSELGRHLMCQSPEPQFPPAVSQALLVQPNAEVLAYRQGLTPTLIGKLTRFARWKTLGAACTLELTAEQTYRGLESGLTLPAVLQTLNQHGLRPVPATVTDLLRRWADKRDRITVYTAATLVEFQTPADLDAAIARGVVAVRITERIGLTDDGRDPEFKHLRLIGNRDYDAKPLRCVSIADDGVTLTVDTGHADLPLDAEIARLADPVSSDPPGVRRYRITPGTLARATAAGVTASELDAWFHQRAGEGSPPTVKLFTAPRDTPVFARHHTVLHLPDVELTDGLVQWPETAHLLGERLGPTTVSIPAANLAALTQVLANLGVNLHEPNSPAS